MGIRRLEACYTRAMRPASPSRPGARSVALPGRNHLFLETEPAFAQFVEQTRTFLAS